MITYTNSFFIPSARSGNIHITKLYYRNARIIIYIAKNLGHENV